MNLDKAELKLLILGDLGCDFEDVKDSMVRDLHQQEGAAAALTQAAKSILALCKLVDDDIEKGRYELPEAERLKQYISRAATVCDEMSKKARVARQVAEGRVQGVDHIVKIVKKRHDAEEQKKLMLQAAIAEAEATGEEVDLRSRPVGLHPGASIAQARRAEETEAAKEASEVFNEVKAGAKNGATKKKASKRKTTKKKTPRRKTPRNGAHP